MDWLNDGLHEGAKNEIEEALLSGSSGGRLISSKYGVPRRVQTWSLAAASLVAARLGLTGWVASSGSVYFRAHIGEVDILVRVADHPRVYTSYAHVNYELVVKSEPALSRVESFARAIADFLKKPEAELVELVLTEAPSRRQVFFSF